MVRDDERLTKDGIFSTKVVTSNATLVGAWAIREDKEM
jgi:hypothetical protein